MTKTAETSAFKILTRTGKVFGGFRVCGKNDLRKNKISRDGLLNEKEFDALIRSLYSFNGNIYYISKSNQKKIFNLFDENKV
jgi:hypothetical protein